MKKYIRLFILFLSVLCVCSAFAADDWMPDPHLRQLVRETLDLPDEARLTKLELKRVTSLTQFKSDVSDITGLEHATNLQEFIMLGSHVTDLTPIRHLTNLNKLIVAWNKTKLSDISPLSELINLQHLDLNANAIVDITPLAALTQLHTLKIQHNQISDITPLVGLTQLIHLDLAYNQISDITSLVGLIQIKELLLTRNQIVDFSPVQHLPLVLFEHDEVCELPRLSIQDRIYNRLFPSILSAWGNIKHTTIFNRPDLSNIEQVASHDLHFGRLFTNFVFLGENEETRIVRYVNENIELRNALVHLNPHMLFIASMRIRTATISTHHENWRGWFRDKNGKRVRDHTTPNLVPSYFIDFTQPEAIDWIVSQAVAISHCGLYDGIFYDWWKEHKDIFFHPASPSLSAQQQARLEILRRIRENADEDFLILVNVGRYKIPHTAPYINGAWMEAGKDHPEGYSHAGLMQIENTLSWSEENLREPRINALAGEGIHLESPNSALNKKWMRVITTLSLTHSDGYVSYNTGIRGNPHDHSIVRILDTEYNQKHYEDKHQSNIYHTHDHERYLYDFWDADLGRPVSEKAQHYENQKGLFIREFTNGWAVYNRSYAEQTIEFTVPVRGSSNGLVSSRAVVPDLDGEIFLKIDIDLNDDGYVNILDLVIVANAFSQAEPDLNGDGVVNILDLVLLANNID